MSDSSLLNKMDSLDLNYEEIEEILMCSICQDGVANPPIYNCTNGHVLCSSCIEKIKECPVCRVPLAQKIRNRTVEQLAQNLLLRCKNEVHGCPSKVKMLDYAEHLQVCPYREFKHCKMLGSNCCDELTSERGFQDHVSKSHYKTRFNSCGFRGVIFQEILKSELERCGEIIWEPIFLPLEGDQMVTIMSKFDKADQAFSWQCALCPNSLSTPSELEETAKNYTVQIIMQKESSEEKIHWTGGLLSFSKLKKEFNSTCETIEENLFCLPVKTIRGFASKELLRVLKWTVKVAILKKDELVPHAVSLFPVDDDRDIPSVNSIVYHEGRKDKNKLIHVGVTCDSCKNRVRGIRYKCTECPDFDLCENCEKLGAHDHHILLRIVSEALKPKLYTYFKKLFRSGNNVDGEIRMDHPVPGVQKPIHYGITCDSCLGGVRGIRYKCTECADFDLCENCEKLGVHDHHIFLRSAQDAMKPRMYNYFKKLFRNGFEGV